MRQHILKIRLYPEFLYFLLEKWLKKMSCNGYHLIDCKLGFIYKFEVGAPKEKEYFAWSPTATGAGRFSITMRYPNLIKTFGVDKRKSILNKNAISKNICIIEINTQNQQTNHSVAYTEMKKDRNQLYWFSFLCKFCICLVIFILLVMI